MRLNGCFLLSGKPSINIFQVATAAVFASFLVGFYCLFVPLVRESTLKTLSLAAYSAIAVLVVILDFACTLTDPSDSNLKRKLNFVKEKREWDDGIHSQVVGEVFYCVLCEVSVDHRSKHCRTCDKCVQSFDHHCKWLNNCVGERNYASFFSLLCLTLLLIIGQLGVVVTLFAYAFVDENAMTQQIKDKLGAAGVAVSREAFLVFSSLYMLVLAATAALLGELLSFHVILATKHMTTYDYIVAERMRKECVTVDDSDTSMSASTASRSRQSSFSHNLSPRLPPQQIPATVPENGEPMGFGEVTAKKSIWRWSCPCKQGKVASTSGTQSRENSKGGKTKVSISACALLRVAKPVPEELKAGRANTQRGSEAERGGQDVEQGQNGSNLELSKGKASIDNAKSTNGSGVKAFDDSSNPSKASFRASTADDKEIRRPEISKEKALFHVGDLPPLPIPGKSMGSNVSDMMSVESGARDMSPRRML
eukprot:CAMPEP_0114229418 /NCGR_PEP_ID=MMETSP0058-20121206/2894_1 /TAXON_ID=36894 /ORGANISM="Pyramimonas parkeae, CCMP726" /LENGTH=479 /DNA_ID=CAMNT_0001340487 /DNA_START=438 /DNA_END=1877 /DNA_ORIENTATION=+